MENQLEAKQSFWQKISFLHCILFAAFPILFIYASNFGQISRIDIYRPLILSILVAILLLIFLKYIFKNIFKAALMVTVLLFWFFSFSQFYLGLKEKFKWEVGEWYYLIVWTIIFVLILFFLIKLKNNLALSRLLLYISILLIAMQIWNIAVASSKSRNKNYYLTENSTLKEIPVNKNLNGLPDIYYIIVDGYARDDILKNVYGYDNSAFINFLKKNKFYVARDAYSNYSQTALSLTSSLNMVHLQDLKNDSGDRMVLENAIHNSVVRAMLEKQNYKFVTFSTDYSVTDIKDADYYFQSKYNFSEFNRFLFETTVASYFLKKYTKWNQYDLHYGMVLNTFDKLKTIPQIDSPKFVFTHIVVPHPPFMIDKNGHKTYSENSNFSMSDASHWHKMDPKMQQEYRQRYIGQLQLVTKELQKDIASILNNKKPFVLVIQSDHGPGSNLDWEEPSNDGIRERMSILNAYYFSDQKYQNLYQDITPINTFRTIFNQYFETNYKKAADKSYYSSWNYPYHFNDVTEKIK